MHQTTLDLFSFFSHPLFVNRIFSTTILDRRTSHFFAHSIFIVALLVMFYKEQWLFEKILAVGSYTEEVETEGCVS
jgi:hypothetical protein